MDEKPAPSKRPLSPSRAGDFKRCPQLYKFKTVDGIVEPPSQATLRGSIVHKVLEDLFEREASERTHEEAEALVPATMAQFERRLNELPEVVSGGDAVASVVRDEITGEVGRAIKTYFQLEDPSAIEVAGRELRVTGDVGGITMVGIIDRIDRLADGTFEIVDYKTGKAPRPEYAKEAFFAMRIYAVLATQHAPIGVSPRRLRLLYLGSAESVELDVEERHLAGTARQIAALAEAIALAISRDQFRANPSRLCDWCYFKPICPAFGGSGLASDLISPTES